MTRTFEVTRRSYAIRIDEDDFIDLLNSESYVTDHAAFKDGNETLTGKLDRLPGVSKVEYDGHYGAAVYLWIDAGKDVPELQATISKTIDRHLAWCTKVKIRNAAKARSRAA